MQYAVKVTSQGGIDSLELEVLELQANCTHSPESRPQSCQSILDLAILDEAKYGLLQLQRRRGEYLICARQQQLL